jgi:hypothetical protein
MSLLKGGNCSKVAFGGVGGAQRRPAEGQQLLA